MSAIAVRINTCHTENTINTYALWFLGVWQRTFHVQPVHVTPRRVSHPHWDSKAPFCLRLFTVLLTQILIKRSALIHFFLRVKWSSTTSSTPGIIPHPIYEFTVGFYLSRLCPLFCFSRPLTNLVSALSLGLIKTPLEGHMAVNFSWSHCISLCCRHICWLYQIVPSCPPPPPSTYDVVFATLPLSSFSPTCRPVHPGMNIGVSSVPLTYNTGVKYVIVNGIKDFHRTLVLKQWNAVPYDAFLRSSRNNSSTLRIDCRL